MRSLFALLFLIPVLVIIGCSSSESSVDNAPLTGTEWTLFEMNDIKYESAAGKNVTMKFDSKEKQINGKAPCNTYGGPYTKSSNKLSFGGLYSTEMACDELGKEQEYFSMLAKVFAYQVSGDKLYLFDSGGMVVARFKAK